MPGAWLQGDQHGVLKGVTHPKNIFFQWGNTSSNGGCSNAMLVFFGGVCLNVVEKFELNVM